MPATSRLRSIETVSVPRTLPEKLKAIAAAGFDSVEIFEDDLLKNPVKPVAIRIGYEALTWGKHVNRYLQAWDRVREVNHPALGIVLDRFHVLAVGDNLDRLDEVPLDKISFLQLADAPFKDMNVQQWSRSYRCYPGQGDLPPVDFVSTLNQKGFNGSWSLEIFNDKILSLADGLRSLTELEKRMLAYHQITSED